MSSAISHERKLIFVHPPKTGGSSVTYSLLDVFDTPNEGAVPHRRLWDLTVDHRGYFKFMIVRNPWDQCASWLKWNLLHEDPDRSRTIYQAARQVETPSWFGLREIDFVLRFERLTEDFAVLCKKIGVEARELLHLNASTPEDYRKFYDENARRIVAERFWYEIEQFGYVF
jgi:hypothetical protein